MYDAFFKMYSRFRNWFIGSQLAANNNEIDRSKLKLAFVVYFIYIATASLWLPFLINMGNQIHLIIALAVMALHIGLLFMLRYGVPFMITCHISNLFNFLMICVQTYTAQEIVSFIAIGWLSVVHLFLFFMCGRKKALRFMMVSVSSVVAITAFKILNYPYPAQDEWYYAGVLFSVITVFFFLYLIIGRFLKYNELLIGKLIDSEIRLSTIVDNLPFAIIYNYKDKFFLNKEFEKFTGYSSKEISNMMQAQQLLIPEGDEENKLKLDLIQAEILKPDNVMIPIQTRSGDIKTAQVFFQKGIDFEIWLLQDVTESEAKKQELKESVYFIENISKVLPHILYVFDFETRRNVYVNDSLTTILGYTAAEFRSLFNVVYDAIHPDDMNNVMKHVRSIESMPDNSLHFIEYRIKSKKGDYVWLRSTEKVFRRNKSGTVKYVIGVAEDITRQKQDELKNLRINHILKTINLSRNEAMTSDNDAALRQLLADVGKSIGVDEMFVCELDSTGGAIKFHDIYAWRSQTHYNDENHASKPDCDKNCLDEILQARFEDLQQGKTIIVNQAQDEFYDLLQSKNIQSALIAPVFFAEKFWGVMVVKNKISEKTWEEYEIDIIENFAQTMGAAITKNKYKTMLEAAKEKAEAESRAKTEFLKSISHEIKTPLNIINGLTSIMQKETGSKKQMSYLQLIEKSVKDLINVMNNILHFTSRNETEIIIPSDAAGKTDLSSSKVLIVEDNEVNALILKKILQSWNIRYSHVASGREALREFSDANYDLILLDLMLPDIDGYDVVKQIRLRYPAEKSGVPVIAITASLINDETEKLKEAGINDYLVKPFHPDSLHHKMQILLHKKKAAV